MRGKNKCNLDDPRGTKEKINKILQSSPITEISWPSAIFADFRNFSSLFFLYVFLSFCLLFPFFCSIQASLYVVFLLLLSYALIYGSTQDDPTQYTDTTNVVRLICEILSIIFLTFYLLQEIDQAIR